MGSVPPERIDSHISTIFLVGDDAYELTRARVTSYLDYAALEERHRLASHDFAPGDSVTITQNDETDRFYPVASVSRTRIFGT